MAEEARLVQVEGERLAAEARLPAQPGEDEECYEVKVTTPTSVLYRRFLASATVSNVMDFVVSQGFQANRYF